MTRKTSTFQDRGPSELLSAAVPACFEGPASPHPLGFQAALKSSKRKNKAEVLVISLEEKYFLGLLYGAESISSTQDALACHPFSGPCQACLLGAVHAQKGAQGPAGACCSSLQHTYTHLRPQKETTPEKRPSEGAAQLPRPTLWSRDTAGGARDQKALSA